MSKENLYHAWDDFVRGKRKRPDVNIFALRLSDNIADLYQDLTSGNYTHGWYEEYMICDPKKRIIHKASVRDRVVHRLLYNALYPYFDQRFFHDSYSCRIGKGTHRARDRFRTFANLVSRNYTKPCYALKFDIKQCFANIDPLILKSLLRTHISDERLCILFEKIIDSFENGLPLGNLTSQLFINIYFHELDHYVTHTLRAETYIRYADDVVVLHSDRAYLEQLFLKINQFLSEVLCSIAHKVEIRSLYAGVDVLGEVFFAEYKRLRRSTERRMKRRHMCAIPMFES